MKILIQLLVVMSTISITMSIINLYQGQGPRTMYISLVIIGIFDLIVLYFLYRHYTRDQ